MKFLVILSCFAAFTSAAVDPEVMKTFIKAIREMGEKCLPETHATMEDLDNLLKTHVIPEKYEAKCLIFCFHKNYNYQREDGSVNKDGALESLEVVKEEDPELHAHFVEIVHTCGNRVPAVSDPCQFAADLAQCGIEESRKLGLTELMLE